MPIAALWYGVIIGEMVYLGGEWVDKWRTKKRAALRKDIDKKKVRRERQKRRAITSTSDSPAAHPVYEDYDSGNEHDDEPRHRPRYYLQNRSHSSPAQYRRIEHNERHPGYPTDRSRSYQSPPPTNMDRTLVLADDPRSVEFRPAFTLQQIANMDYGQARSVASDPTIDIATRQAASDHLLKLERWFHQLQRNPPI